MQEEEVNSSARHQTEFFTNKSASDTTTLTPLSSGSNAAKSSYNKTETIVTRSTPVLFCTSRGLHLRLAKPAGKIPAKSEKSTVLSGSSKIYSYEFKFCDLERWSTIRANAIGLDETYASKNFNLQNNDRMIPTKHSTVRFNTNYSTIKH